jgi:rubrerythrin
MTPWNLIFSSILLSCGAKETDTSTSTTDTSVSPDTCDGVDCYGECLEAYESTQEFTLTTSEFSAYLDEDGNLSAEGCTNICSDQVENLYIGQVEEVLSCIDTQIDDGANVQCTMLIQPWCEGRFHEGVPRPMKQEGSPFQQWLARAAQSERASVQSFLLLAQELKEHGAPQDLLVRLRQAAKEEVSHARMIHNLCEENNISVPKMKETTPQSRSLFDLALENIVEGCVHERYAALQAHHQARYAQSEKVRIIFSKIAIEEGNHTDLAQDIHHWLCTKLSKEEQELLLHEQQIAQKNLISALDAREDNNENIILLGIPSSQKAITLAQTLHRYAS